MLHQCVPRCFYPSFLHMRILPRDADPDLCTFMQRLRQEPGAAAAAAAGRKRATDPTERGFSRHLTTPALHLQRCKPEPRRPSGLSQSLSKTFSAKVLHRERNTPWFRPVPCFAFKKVIYLLHWTLISLFVKQRVRPMTWEVLFSFEFLCL